MSEETRRIREKELERIEKEICDRGEEIANIQILIDILRDSRPSELPEDREWRIKQMPPQEQERYERIQRMLREMNESWKRDYDFMSGERWPFDNPGGEIGTPIRIVLPKDYTVAKDES